MKGKKDATIQVRVTEAEKMEIKNKADILGTSTSVFLRTLATKPDAIKVLANGQAVAESMISLSIDIEHAVRTEKISEHLSEEFLKKLEDISRMFSEILRNTDDISFDEGEEE